MMFRALVLFALLAGCSVAARKSLVPAPVYTDFRSSVHIAAETRASRMLVYFFRTKEGFGLATPMGRNEARIPRLRLVRAAPRPPRRLDLTETFGGFGAGEGQIVMAPKTLEKATQASLPLDVCGNTSCYDALLPPGLFQQAFLR